MKKGLLFIIVVMAGLQSIAQSSSTSSNDSQSHNPQASTLNSQILFGYLSYDSALVAMPDYALLQKQLADLRQAYNDEMKRIEDEFNRKYEDFLDGQKDFPRTILLKRQTELQEMMQRNLEFKHQGQAELQQCEREMMEPLRAKLNEAIATVAREKKLALVVNTDANACPFIDPEMGIDIQEPVILMLTK